MKQRIKSVIWKTREKETPRQSSKKKKRIKKNEEGLRNILDNMRCNNIHIMGITKREKSEQGIEIYLDE